MTYDQYYKVGPFKSSIQLISFAHTNYTNKCPSLNN